MQLSINCKWTSHTFLEQQCFPQSRCESILRTQPDTRIAKELHLACIEAEEERKREQLKQAAVGSIAAAAVVGVIGIASMLLSKKH